VVPRRRFDNKSWRKIRSRSGFLAHACGRRKETLLGVDGRFESILGGVPVADPQPEHWGRLLGGSPISGNWASHEKETRQPQFGALSRLALRWSAPRNPPGFIRQKQGLGDANLSKENPLETSRRFRLFFTRIKPYVEVGQEAVSVLCREPPIASENEHAQLSYDSAVWKGNIEALRERLDTS